MALFGLRADNLNSQCGNEDSMFREEGIGFFELGSWCAEDRMAGIWGLEGEKKVSPQKTVEQL